MRISVESVRECLHRAFTQHPIISWPTQDEIAQVIYARFLRHYFCSTSATNNVPEQILMNWLGHQDSKMVRLYYHLHDGPSQAQMERTEFLTVPPS